MPKRVLLSLNGLILMEGNIERFEDKNSFMDKFESLRPDLFFPDEWTDEQKEKAVPNQSLLKYNDKNSYTF